jgi:hypothetical protein
VHPDPGLYVGGQAAAVVGHRQLERAVQEGEVDRDTGRPSVLAGVGHCLGDDPERGEVDRGGKHERLRCGDPDVELVVVRGAVDDRGDQAVVVEDGRPEL